MKAVVTIQRREGIADPEGVTILRALADLGFGEVDAVRVNRTFELQLSGADHARAADSVRAMCQKLLANPALEDFEIEIVE